MPEAIRTPAAVERLPRPIEPVSRVLGAFWGMWIGDALAMPAHQYADPSAIERDYRILNSYRKPKLPHPGSRVSRNDYKPASPKYDIVGDQKALWGKAGTHPHQNLQPGQNTLTLQLAKVLYESLVDHEGLNFDDYQQRFLNFMLKPDAHGDTWVEECYREFFDHYAQGRPPMGCGVEDHNMSGLALVLPIFVYYAHQPKEAVQHARKVAELSHKGEFISKTIGFLGEVFSWVFRGKDLETIFYRKIGSQGHSALQYPLKQWLKEDEFELIGHRLFNRSIIEESLPTALFLALKYENDPARALLINAHLGGDSCNRGAVLGALLGARRGIEVFPPEWVFELVSYHRLDVISDALIKRA